MSVRIRLRRMGAKKQAFYRVVVADSRSPRDGRFLDTIGTYNPRTVPVAIDLDREKTLRWLEDGALPTDSARALLSQVGIWQEFKTGVKPEFAQPAERAVAEPAASESVVEEPAVAEPVVEEPVVVEPVVVEPTAVQPEAAEETPEASATETRGEE